MLICLLGVTITLVFSVPTNMGGFSISSPFSCSRVLDAASQVLVGASSSCSWNSDTTIVISLASTATIVPGNSVGIQANLVFAVGGLGSAASGSIAVSQPEKPDAPSFSLTGPAKVSACDQFVSKNKNIEKDL